MVNGKMSYSSGGNSTRFLAAHLAVIILTVIVLGIIFAVACAAVAFEIAEPMAINAQAIEELRMKSKLKAVQGSNPQKTLDAYIEAKGRKVGVDDAATYPPHPSFRDMMNLTVEGNTWNVPSEVKERNTRSSGDPDEVSSFHVPEGQLSTKNVSFVEDIIMTATAPKPAVEVLRQTRQAAAAAAEETKRKLQKYNSFCEVNLRARIYNPLAIFKSTISGKTYEPIMETMLVNRNNKHIERWQNMKHPPPYFNRAEVDAGICGGEDSEYHFMRKAAQYGLSKPIQRIIRGFDTIRDECDATVSRAFNWGKNSVPKKWWPVGINGGFTHRGQFVDSSPLEDCCTNLLELLLSFVDIEELKEPLAMCKEITPENAQCGKVLASKSNLRKYMKLFKAIVLFLSKNYNAAVAAAINRRGCMNVTFTINGFRFQGERNTIRYHETISSVSSCLAFADYFSHRSSSETEEEDCKDVENTIASMMDQFTDTKSKKKEDESVFLGFFCKGLIDDDGSDTEVDEEVERKEGKIVDDEPPSPKVATPSSTPPPKRKINGEETEEAEVLVEQPLAKKTKPPPVFEEDEDEDVDSIF